MPGVLSGGAPHRRAAPAALVAGLAAFGAIAAVALTGASADVDVAVNEALGARRSPLLTAFFEAYTGLGQWFVVAVAGVAVITGLAATRRRRAAAFLTACLAAALVLNPLLKLAFGRVRPPVEDAALHVSGLAFPSGHSLASATLALAVAVVAWPTRWRLPATVVVATFAVLMGLSRLYLGVHWLTDVLGAWALAVVVVAAVSLVLPPRPVAPAAGRPARATAGVPAAGTGRGRDSAPVAVVLVDWGGTLMQDDGTQPGPMATWSRVAAVDGAAEALELLREDHRIIVATNAGESGARDVRAALARVGLAGLVDDVVSSRDVGAAKPDTFFYRAALLRAGHGGVPLRSRDAVMVGDSWANDVEGARRAGLRTVWFNPARTRRPAGAAPPDAEVARLADLPRAVAALQSRPPAAAPGPESPAGGA